MCPSRSFELIDAREPCVQPIWRSLEEQVQPAYFLSWGWIENWLSALPASEGPPLAVLREDGAVTAAFFLGHRRVRRHLVMTSNALFLNATGSPRHDEVCIEHNGLLAAPGKRRSLAGLLELLPDDWDELFLPAIDRYAFDDLGASTSNLARYRVRIDRETVAPFVDLEAVRSVPGRYLTLLRPSTRTQMRRTHAIIGELNFEVASDEYHALDIWDELLRLHAESSQSGGGAFADPWFEGLHRRLIEQRLRHGEIQLMRVRASGTTIGCLYNFVYGGRVLFYQSGFASFDDPRIKPDYLCHAAAVEYNALAGLSIYDLLGGEARSKRALATGESRLVWVRVQRPLARFQIEDRVRAWKRTLDGVRPRIAVTPA